MNRIRSNGYLINRPIFAKRIDFWLLFFAFCYINVTSPTPTTFNLLLARYFRSMFLSSCDIYQIYATPIIIRKKDAIYSQKLIDVVQYCFIYGHYHPPTTPITPKYWRVSHFVHAPRASSSIADPTQPCNRGHRAFRSGAAN